MHISIRAKGAYSWLTAGRVMFVLRDSLMYGIGGYVIRLEFHEFRNDIW